MSTRIVITGIGWVTPLGWAIESVWQKLLAGTSAIERIRHFDATTFPTTFAAQVPAAYDYRQFITHSRVHEDVGRNTTFALGAAAQAWHGAGLDQYGGLQRDRLGIYLGSGEGGPDFDAYVSASLAAWDADTRSVDAGEWVKHAAAQMHAVREIEQEPNMPLSHVAMEFDAHGPAYNCLTACAASTQAVGEAAQIIRRGNADVMITGGAHTMIHPFGVTGFNRLTALSTRNDDYKTASRPFSHDRDGFVLGEGAGMLIIESLEHAQARGVKPLAEIVGYGSSADAYRITDIEPEGRGAVVAMHQAMHQALDHAGLEPNDIDYISAHGTGTKENDAIESKAVKRVFGDAAACPPMSSVKSMMGHLIAAAGAMELITCVLALRDQKLPPTINLNNPDPAMGLDNVPNQARDAEVNVALSNSFGFGGQNDTLIIKRV